MTCPPLAAKPHIPLRFRFNPWNSANAFPTGAVAVWRCDPVYFKSTWECTPSQLPARLNSHHNYARRPGNEIRAARVGQVIELDSIRSRTRRIDHEANGFFCLWG